MLLHSAHQGAALAGFCCPPVVLYRPSLYSPAIAEATKDPPHQKAAINAIGYQGVLTLASHIAYGIWPSCDNEIAALPTLGCL